MLLHASEAVQPQNAQVRHGMHGSIILAVQTISDFSQEPDNSTPLRASDSLPKPSSHEPLW
jgi:hypothetical protein